MLPKKVIDRDAPLLRRLRLRARVLIASAKPQAAERTWTAARWRDYFLANAARSRPIPWERGAEATAEELSAIAKSLQAWQLGETSEGRHLRAGAARHAEQTGERDFPAAIDLFIRKDQRHGELLGYYLDLAGVGRVKSDWGDGLFRAARYFMTNMEVWTTPVVMVEVLALVYYNGMWRLMDPRRYVWPVK
jgi:hypothetical protein